MDNWLQTKPLLLQGEAYFPELAPAGTSIAQVFKSSSREGSASVRLMYLMSFAAAERSIRIESAYFLPDDETVATLTQARRRGVMVEIIVPGAATDNQVVRAASRSRWAALLAAGVRIWEFEPTMLHCKVLVVDDCWASVGSTNLDDRSFRLNDEANLNVLGAEFAAEQLEQFKADQARSREYSLSDLQRRPWYQRAGEKVAGLFRSQL